VNARGEAREALDWASLTGKDALLWETFRPLEQARVQLARLLQEALASPASGFDLDPIEALDAARFNYWWRPEPGRWGRPETGVLGLGEPAELFEVDVCVEAGRSALVYVQTFEEGEWERWESEIYPDPLLCALDFGTAEARARGINDFYLVAVTPRRAPLLPYSMRIRQYRDHPDLLRLALAHRADLTLQDFAILAGRIGWITWREVERWGR
jgi:hypothetical protein